MYDVRVTRQFVRATRKVDRSLLEKARDDIVADPYQGRGTHLLAHDWSGVRAADFDGRHRIIYRVCEECVKLQLTEQNPLACCGQPDRPLLVITFVDFGDYHDSAGRRRLRPAGFYDVP
jgi:Txe/YoeB family toxin of Txe-Axe toxin-antitoxin module